MGDSRRLSNLGPLGMLVRDGGTLQIGIGELGDAIVYALMLARRNPQFKLFTESGVANRFCTHT